MTLKMGLLQRLLSHPLSAEIVLELANLAEDRGHLTTMIRLVVQPGEFF